MGKRQVLPVSRLTRENGELSAAMRTLLLGVTREWFRFILLVAIKCEVRPQFRRRARFARAWRHAASQIFTNTKEHMSMDADLYDFLTNSGMPVAFEEGNAEVPFLHLGKDETENHSIPLTDNSFHWPDEIPNTLAVKAVLFTLRQYRK